MFCGGRKPGIGVSALEVLMPKDGPSASPLLKLLWIAPLERKSAFRTIFRKNGTFRCLVGKEIRSMKKFPKEKCRFHFLGVSKKGPSNGIIAFPEEVSYYIIIVDS